MINSLYLNPLPFVSNMAPEELRFMASCACRSRGFLLNQHPGKKEKNSYSFLATVIAGLQQIVRHKLVCPHFLFSALFTVFGTWQRYFVGIIDKTNVFHQLSRRPWNETKRIKINTKPFKTFFSDKMIWTVKKFLSSSIGTDVFLQWESVPLFMFGKRLEFADHNGFYSSIVFVSCSIRIVSKILYNTKANSQRFVCYTFLSRMIFRTEQLSFTLKNQTICSIPIFMVQ